MEFIVHDLEELNNFADLFVDSYLKSFRKVFFYGGIGAGKTTFIKLICKKLGVVDFTSSPTFALVNCYQIERSKLSVNHADLYRIKFSEEILDAGIHELLIDEDYFFVEWPDLLEPFCADTPLKVFLNVEDEEIRHIRIAGA